MKRSRLKPIGKKGEEWFEAKLQLVQIYQVKKITQCENCGSKFGCSFHHRPKRGSQKAEHTFEKTRLLCWECHPFFEQNNEADQELFAKPRGYDPRYKINIMARRKKDKKAEWAKRHKCVRCKKEVEVLLCPFCENISVKMK